MKKLLIAVAALLVVFTSCDKKEATPDSGVTATKIAFAEKSYTVVAGETVALKLVAEPENASLAGVQFTSKKEEVATVDKDGVVTAVNAGTTTIIATLGELKATTKVIVEAVPVPATGIKVEPSEVSVMAGKSVTVKASLLPENTTEKLDATWSSADASIAAVDGGVIRGVAEGTTTVTVKHGDFSADVKVTVEASSIKDRSADWTMTHASRWQQSYNGATAVVDVTLSVCDAEKFYFRILGEGETFDLETLVAAVEAKKKEAEGYGDDPASLFASEVPATQTSYRMGEQTAYVLAYDAELNFANEYAVYNFTAVEPDPVPATGIVLSPETMTLIQGKSNYISATLTPEDATDSMNDIVWSVDDESVATIIGQGSYCQVTAVAIGTATVTATLGELTATCVVTVEEDTTVWTDRSADWTWETGTMDSWGTTYPCFTLNSCTSPKHMIVVLTENDLAKYGITTEPNSIETLKSLLNQYESWLDYYASDAIPDSAPCYSGDGEYYAYVAGVADGAYDGDYMIVKFVTGGSDPDDPDDPAGEGNLANMKTCFFDYTWPDSEASLDNVSMEVWVKTSGSNGNQSIIGVEGSFLLRTENKEWQLVCKDANNQEIKLTSSYSDNLNKWTHLAVTYSRAGEACLYVNGELKDSKAVSDIAVPMNGVGDVWQMPFTFMIGNACDGGRYIQGSIVYARVWSRVISASEIAANMYTEAVSDSDLLASWYFTDGTGNNIADYSGNGRTLTAKKYQANNPGTTDPEKARANIVETDIEWYKGTLPFGGEIPESSNGNVPDYGTVPGFQW